jgi:hypothetical protein
MLDVATNMNPTNAAASVVYHVEESVIYLGFVEENKKCRIT